MALREAKNSTVYRFLVDIPLQAVALSLLMPILLNMINPKMQMMYKPNWVEIIIKKAKLYWLYLAYFLLFYSLIIRLLEIRPGRPVSPDQWSWSVIISSRRYNCVSATSQLWIHINYISKYLWESSWWRLIGNLEIDLVLIGSQTNGSY